MELDRGVIERLGKYAWRLPDLRERFGDSRVRLNELRDHPQIKQLGLFVGEMNKDDSFTVSCAGVNLVLRMSNEMGDNGSLRGRVTFYELTRSTYEPERKVDSVTFTHKGEAHATVMDSSDTDLPYLESWLVEMVLGVVEKVLQGRGRSE